MGIGNALSGCWSWLCGPRHIWPTNDYAVLNRKYKRPAAKYAEMLRQLKLSPLAKTQLALRFTDLITRYTRLVYWSGIRVGTLRVVILVGGVMVPALVIGGELVEDGCAERPITPWITLGVSMVVSLSTGVMETFSLSHRHQTYLLTLRQLDYEAWSFISLSGRYAKYKRHSKCWRKFAAQVEHVNSLSVENFAMMGGDNDADGENSDSKGSPGAIEFGQASNDGSMTSHSDDDEIAGGYVIGVQHPRPASSILSGSGMVPANGTERDSGFVSSHYAVPVLRRQSSEAGSNADDEGSAEVV